MKRCPKCGCDRFVVTMHVTQTVIVDDEGQYVSTVSECDDIIHAPDDDDIWECENCGYDDVGSKFNIKEEE